MAAQIIAAEETIAGFLTNNPNVSSAVSDAVSRMSTTFTNRVGTIVSNAETAFDGADGLPGFLDNLAAETKGVVSTTFNEVVTKVNDGDVDLSLKDVSRNLNPVLNNANKALSSGLKEVQREALAELKAASKTLQTMVSKEIVSFKKEITAQGKALRKMVASDPNLLVSVENFLVEVNSLIDDELPDDIFKAADIKTFVSASAATIKEKTSAM